jgi:hypothetical protein
MSIPFNIATHEGRQHADEMMACAIFALMFEPIRIVRTGDARLIRHADAAVDVGGSYDPENLRFDHHGKIKTPAPPSGRPGYAAAGLVWKHFGRDVVKALLSDDFMKSIEGDVTPAQIEELVDVIVRQVDLDVIAPIDAWDLGQRPRESGFMPVQWLVRHLNFAEGVMGMARGLTARVLDIADRWRCFYLLHQELMRPQDLQLFAFPNGLLIVAGEMRVDFCAAAKFSRDVVGMDLFGIISRMPKRNSWTLALSNPGFILSDRVTSRGDRRLHYCRHKEVLMTEAKRLAGFVVEQPERNE